ncbi:MAG: sigma-70 family RNA polymerase sigma factor [Candidatus Elarobacter sp.]
MIDREQVLADYCSDRTIERRNAVVDAYRHLCVRGARKFKRARNDRADLEQVAAIGLIKAAAKYRAEMATPFHVYAWIIIVGELMHYTRDLERLVRLPRSLYELERRYSDAWDSFVAAYQREPTAAELGTVMGVNPSLVIELRSVRNLDIVPFPEPRIGGGEPIEALPNASIGIALEERVALGLALDELGERERTIVLGTYGAGLTQNELARHLGLSQSHISKLLSRALGKLGRRVA